jgi:hypothetical protein
LDFDIRQLTEATEQEASLLRYPGMAIERGAQFDE